MSATDVILITGTTSGFGRLMAETLARKGYTVYASMRQVTGRNASAGDALRTLAEKEGLSLHVVDLDVTDEGSVERAVQTLMARTGRIDVLINNAGFGIAGLNETYSVEDVQRQFDTNVFSVVRMNRAVLPHMRRQKSGFIVYISSASGRMVFPFLGIYAASKFALEALAESYHYQLHGLGIDSVIVEPGRYATAVPANSPQPSDPTRATGYGEIGVRLEQAATDFMASFSDPSCPDPQEVADAVAELVAMPPGARPLRISLGAPRAYLESLNQVIAETQAGILERSGLAWLMKRDAHQS